LPIVISGLAAISFAQKRKRDRVRAGLREGPALKSQLHIFSRCSRCRIEVPGLPHLCGGLLRASETAGGNQ
jgi:hypothetical protein